MAWLVPDAEPTPQPAPEALIMSDETSAEERSVLDAAKQIEVVDVEDLSQFQDLPKVPDPFTVIWPKGDKLLRLTVVPKYPDDSDWFGARFMTAIREARTPTYDGDKKKDPSFPHRGKEFKLLRDECIVSPKWLKNPEAFAKLPIPMQSAIHNRLQLAVGMDGDFFGDMAALSMTKSSLVLLSESARRSDSSLTKSVPVAPPSNSSPTT